MVVEGVRAGAAEQQDRGRERAGGERQTAQELVRLDQIPGNEEREELRDDGRCAAPPLCPQQPAGDHEHAGAAEYRENGHPDRARPILRITEQRLPADEETEGQRGDPLAGLEAGGGDQREGAYDGHTEQLSGPRRTGVGGLNVPDVLSLGRIGTTFATAACSYPAVGTLGDVRALLIANPKATSTARRVRDILVHAFAGDLDLEISETAHRGHATQIARRATDERFDVVVALGGDGTVNEVVNGLLADDGGAARPTGGVENTDVPALAVLPGGSANVFARSLGLSNDPIKALGPILNALRAGRYRTVGLGRADQRYFTFCAGIGWDAEVIQAVENHRVSGSQANPVLYVRTALRQFFAVTDRRHPALTLERPGLPPLGGLFLVIVSNTSPWTYLGPRPVNPSPEADINLGLDIFALRRLDLLPMLGTVVQMMLPLSQPLRGRHVVNVHDAAEVTVRSRRPIAFQLDGDYLGDREVITFRVVPKAVRIVI